MFIVNLYRYNAAVSNYWHGVDMSEQFKDPFNILYLLVFVLLLLIPTLPATLSWLKFAGVL